MTKIIAALLFLSLTTAVRAECISPSTAHLIGEGKTMKQMRAQIAKLREEAKRSKIPLLDPYNTNELSTSYQKGDLYYSYESGGPNKASLSGGIALVRGKCIVQLFPNWAA